LDGCACEADGKMAQLAEWEEGMEGVRSVRSQWKEPAMLVGVGRKGGMLIEGMACGERYADRRHGMWGEGC